MSDSPPLLTADQPWRGSEPYTEADRAFFHGRKREVEELRRLLDRDTLTVLTGAGGTGKTSLVRAGLLPSLSPDLLPVFIRLDWSAASEQRALSRQILDAIDAAARARQLDGPAVKECDTLWETFHRTGARWWSARQRVVTPVLVLDQFEEAFTSGAASITIQRHRDRLLEELSQLAANRPPSRVALRIEDGTERDDAFDFGPAPVRILLIVREEFAPRFAALRAQFPTLGRSELRITAFTEAQAREVLVRGASQRGLFADGVIDQLLPRIAAGNEREFPFAPAALSAQALSLAEQRTQRNVAQITADFFMPNQPAAIESPAPAPVEATQPRRSFPWFAIAALLTVCTGAWLWQQQNLMTRWETASVAPAPKSLPPATPEPTPPPTPEVQPRVALSTTPPP
ncbi:MAG: AAA family ATPase [Chthoniobacteraceae bacterium]